MNYKVESDFFHDGLRCVVVLQDIGHRCGYVQVTSEHSAYLLDYGDDLLQDIEVHGGLTYSRFDKNYPVKSKESTWWFGFDAAHYMDKPNLLESYAAGLIDIDTALALTKDYEYKYADEWRDYRSQEYMEEECRKLADQLVELK